MGYQSFEELEVWKKARELKNGISQLVKTFPVEERYRLTDQLIRSSRSINTQIAEGHGRMTWPERLRFSIIARGSLSETLNHLIDALDEKYINEEQLNYYRNKITEVEKLLNGYINYLEKRSKES
ncbi:MAG TPA: four helix bundle protein [Chitinophagaceae bacterium]